MMDEHCSDADLINGLKKGEQKYLIIFVDRFANPLISLVMKRGLSCLDAEEVVNDTLYKATRHIKNFNTGGNAKFFTWLATIALNTATDKYRQKEKSIDTESIEARSARGIHHAYGSEREPNRPDSRKISLSRVLLNRALKELSDTDQQILIERARGYRHKEIGKWLNKSEGAVKVAYHRALKKIKEKYICLLESPEYEADIKTIKSQLNIGEANEKSAN